MQACYFSGEVEIAITSLMDETLVNNNIITASIPEAGVHEHETEQRRDGQLQRHALRTRQG